MGLRTAPTGRDNCLHRPAQGNVAAELKKTPAGADDTGKKQSDLMKRAYILIGASFLAASAWADPEAAFKAASLPPGTIVRLAARRPVISLGHAEVVQCTSNQITVRQTAGTFTVAAADILDLAILDPIKTEPSATNGAAASSANSTNSASKKSGKDSKPGREAANPPPPPRSFWEKVKALWQ